MAIAAHELGESGPAAGRRRFAGIGSNAPILSGRLGAEIGPFVIPLLITVLAQRFAIPVGTVGFLLSAQLGGTVAALLILSSGMARFDRRLIGLGGAAMVLLGNLSLIFGGGGLWMLFGSRGIAGIGEGMIIAATVAAASDARRPDGVFAAISYAIIALSLVVFASVPWLVEHQGAIAAVGWMSAAAMILAAPLLWLPRHRCLAASEQAAAPAARVWTIANAPFLLGYLLFQMGINGGWYFAEPIGHHVGLSARQIGAMLMVASVVSLAGPFVVQRIDLVRNRSTALLVALVVGALAAWMTTSGLSSWALAAGVAISSAIVMFMAPCLLGLAAIIDPGGELGTAAVGCAAIGSALAPAMAGGILLIGGDYPAIGVAGALGITAGGLLLLMFTLRHRRDTRIPVAA